MKFFRRGKRAAEPVQRPLFVDEPYTEPEPVAVSDGVSPVEATRRRYGGPDHAAAIAGMLATIGLTVLLGGLAAAAGVIGYEEGLTDEALSISGFITGLVILMVAFTVGGWVAGRMARYDGARNGFDAAIWTLIVAAGLGRGGHRPHRGLRRLQRRQPSELDP